MSKYTKRSDGRFQTSITIEGKRKYIYGNSAEEIDKKITELKYLNYKGVSLNNENITMNKFANKWLEINSVGKEDGTIKEYTYIINDYIKPNLGHKKLKNIKLYDIREILNTLIESNHLRTAKRTLMLIKRILQDAVVNDIILKNVAVSIKLPVYKPKEKKTLTDIEDKLLIECSKTHKHGLFFLLIRFTGIRKEEAAAIKINKIDFDNNIITIDSAISYVENQGNVKVTKNRKTRNVYILDIFRQQLYDRVDYCKKNGIKYLFTKQTNPHDKLSNSSIRRMLESFLLYMNTTYKNQNENSLNKINFSIHQLRHSFCTMLYYSDIGIKEAQELMGHASADMVYDIYTHLDMKKGDAYNKLNTSIKKLS